MIKKTFTALTFGLGMLTFFGCGDVMAVNCKKPNTNTIISCAGCVAVSSSSVECSCPSNKTIQCSYKGGSGYACAASASKCPEGTNQLSW
jgi:hypothetical protein